MIDWETIDAAFPPAGPCAFCGKRDKRHRVFDAIRGCVKSGASVKEAAYEYRTTVELARAVVAPRCCPVRPRGFLTSQEFTALWRKIDRACKKARRDTKRYMECVRGGSDG